MPRNDMKAMPIRPVIMNAMPGPRRAAGIWLYSSLSRIAAIITIASHQPIPLPRPNAEACPRSG